MKEITTQKFSLTAHLIEEPEPVDIYELIIQDSDTGDLRYIKTNVLDISPEELWELSEPCDYAKARSLEYPSWDEQFDDQYWDKKNGTDTWIKKIDDVKTKYPKP